MDRTAVQPHRSRASRLGHPTTTFTLIAPAGFTTPLRLAHMVDSLVRVSRRVGEGHA